MNSNAFSASVLRLDATAAVAEIESGIRMFVFERLKRKGAVVGLSGGIDSSVVAALCARALGRERVLALFMPEAESSGESLALGQLVASHFGISTCLENIEPILAAARCYARRDEAIHSVIPEYTSEYKCKIVLPDLVKTDSYPVFSVVVRSPEGVEHRARLTTAAYLEVVAATNFKQRTRKMMEYHHADRLNYAVAGTPNLLEYDQGFFVKNGDGAADFKPIAHLYKTQVYQLAEYLGVPEAIRRRPPTTDTYSLQQSQEEFFFAVSYQTMDLCLYGLDHGTPAEQVALAVGLTAEQVERIYRMIASKRKAAQYLHMPPLMIESDAISLPQGK